MLIHFSWGTVQVKVDTEGAARLQRLLSLPTLPAEERRSGLTWLAGNYGHAREHVGHIQLTAQLYRAAPGPVGVSDPASL